MTPHLRNILKRLSQRQTISLSLYDREYEYVVFDTGGVQIQVIEAMKRQEISEKNQSSACIDWNMVLWFISNP
jgi:hypothetical protein